MTVFSGHCSKNSLTFSWKIFTTAWLISWSVLSTKVMSAGYILPSYVTFTCYHGLKASDLPWMILRYLLVFSNFVKGNKYPENPITASIMSFCEKKECKDIPHPCEKPAIIRRPCLLTASSSYLAPKINGLNILHQ